MDVQQAESQYGRILSSKMLFMQANIGILPITVTFQAGFVLLEIRVVVQVARRGAHLCRRGGFEFVRWDLQQRAIQSAMIVERLKLTLTPIDHDGRIVQRSNFTTSLCSRMNSQAATRSVMSPAH